MSSNRKNKPVQGNVNSIRDKLHTMMLLDKIGMKLGFDVLLYILLLGCYLVIEEIKAVGDFDIRRLHWFLNGDPGGIAYEVAEKGTGKVLLTLDPVPMLWILLMVIGVVLIFQVLDIFLSYRREQEKITKILSPLNELALQADRLSRMEFGEDKYQLLEDAIEGISAEEMQPLSLGSPELSGVEAAMNNLLIRIREANRQQARFVNDASHELRTPIAVIDGYANMLARWGKEDEQVLEEAVTAISHESKHMQYLVEQLLFLARGDAGRTMLKKEEFALNDMMREIYEESLMIDEAHRYRLQLPEYEIRMTADQGLLKQAVRILVDNAAKYSAEKDEIILSAGAGNGDVYLQVQDTGIGMAQADVEHMFERFYRAEDARTYKGTGLGLSIAKWIVDRHAGHFEILSRTELGTRIRIVLPQNETK